MCVIEADGAVQQKSTEEESMEQEESTPPRQEDPVRSVEVMCVRARAGTFHQPAAMNSCSQVDPCRGAETPPAEPEQTEEPMEASEPSDIPEPLNETPVGAAGSDAESSHEEAE